MTHHDMNTIDQIKAELRDIIELSDKATPGPWLCVNPPLVKGCPQDEHDENLVIASRNLTPKMARALLTIIEDLEERSKKQAFLLGSLNICPTAEAHTAFSQLETICREWGVQA